MGPDSRIWLLSEDQIHMVFFYSFLREMGLGKRAVTRVKPPHGDGAGDQHVRQEYPRRVSQLRSRSYQANLGLLVVIDADEHEVHERKAQLNEELRDNDLDERNDEDAIAIVVPNRNIETWIHSLRSHTVDEQTDYKHVVNLGRPRDCRSEAARFAELYTQPNQTRHSQLSKHPPSMRDAIDELNRLP